jgi:hypothetical protein
MSRATVRKETEGLDDAARVVTVTRVRLRAQAYRNL